MSTKLSPHRLTALEVFEVSLVDKAANKFKFLLIKNETSMATNTKGVVLKDGPDGTLVNPDKIEDSVSASITAAASTLISDMGKIVAGLSSASLDTTLTNITQSIVTFSSAVGPLPAELVPDTGIADSLEDTSEVKAEDIEVDESDTAQADEHPESLTAPDVAVSDVPEPEESPADTDVAEPETAPDKTLQAASDSRVEDLQLQLINVNKAMRVLAGIVRETRSPAATPQSRPDIDLPGTSSDHADPWQAVTTSADDSEAWYE